MNKLLPFILVIAFWGIFLWGMSNPRVGDAIIALTFIGLIISFSLFAKRVLWKYIDEFKKK
jgi:hypothetical protein